MGLIEMLMKMRYGQPAQPMGDPSMPNPRDIQLPQEGLRDPRLGDTPDMMGAVPSGMVGRASPQVPTVPSGGAPAPPDDISQQIEALMNRNKILSGQPLAQELVKRQQ